MTTKCKIQQTWHEYIRLVFKNLHIWNGEAHKIIVYIQWRVFDPTAEQFKFTGW